MRVSGMALVKDDRRNVQGDILYNSLFRQTATGG